MKTIVLFRPKQNALTLALKAALTAIGRSTMKQTLINSASAPYAKSPRPIATSEAKSRFPSAVNVGSSALLICAALVSAPAIAGGSGGGGGGGAGGDGGTAIGGGQGGAGADGRGLGLGGTVATTGTSAGGGASASDGTFSVGGTAGSGLGGGGGGGGGGAAGGTGGTGGAGGNTGYSDTLASGSSVNVGTETGQIGVAGGDTITVADGGGGGGGGDGVAIAATSSNITLVGSSTGGSGGNGGDSDNNNPGGGGGGNGVLLLGNGNTLTLNATATVEGGDGGIGGVGTRLSVHGVDGGGGTGVYISGDGNTLIDTGTVIGGLDGDTTTRANAVTIVGSNNVLELRSGYSFVGNVVATASKGNVLALGGTTDATFNLASILTTTPVSYSAITGVQYYGFSSFNKTGSGTWTLTGTTTSAAPWSVDAGTLDVAGSLAAATVSVNSGGTLTGSGTVGSTSVASGGTLSAASGSSLAVNGDLSFAAGSTYNVTVNASGLSGLTMVAGNVSIQSGSSLTLNALTGTYAASKTYSILTYTGIESGKFTTVSSNLAYLTPTVSYTNGAISVTLAPTGVPGFALRNSSINSNSVAGALTRIYDGGGNALTNTLVTATTSDARNALTQVSGDEAPAFGQLAAQSIIQSTSVVSQRLASVDTGTGMNYGETNAAAPNKDLWAQIDYSRTRTSGDDVTGAGAYNQRSAALTVGHDRKITSEWRVGGGIAVNDDTVSFENRVASGRIDGAQALLYAAYTPTALPIFVKGGLSAGWWENTINRTLNVGTLSGTTRASFDTTAESAYVETGTNLHLANQYLQPYLGANIARYQQQGYSEDTTSGSNAYALNYDRSHSTTFTTTLGLRLGQKGAILLGRVFDWQLDAGWQHRYGARDTTIQASFANVGVDRFNVTGTELDKDMAVLSAGTAMSINDHAQVYAKVSAALGPNTHAYGGMGGVRWRW